MIRKASILWALAFAICSFAQTTSDDGTAITSNLPSSTDFAALVTAPPNSGDVTTTTTDDTTQPDSAAGQNTNTSSETDNTSQGSDGLASTPPDSTTQTDSDDSNGTSPETDITTQDSDVPDDSSSTTPASVTQSLASDVTPATTDDTNQPDSTGQNDVTPPETDTTTQDSDVPADSSSSTTPTSVATAIDNATQAASNDSTGQDTDIPPETDNTTQSSDIPDGSSPTGNIVQHTADEASVGADDALDQTPGSNLTQNDTSQSPSEPVNSQETSGDNRTENNASLADSTPTTNETAVQDSANYPEGHVNASTPFPQSVITEMSSRKMRYHHYLWHQVREQWNKFTPEVQQSYRDLGWEPPHPARAYDEEGIPSAITDNYSGEDFLYMHREMIATVNDIIARNNESYGQTFGWKTIPGPGDPDWPVPPNYTIPDDPVAENASSTRKTDEFFIRIQNAERSFKDPVQLRNMTLAELGARMEVTIHAWLHMRFSENCSVGIRSQYLNRTNLPYIEEIWDDPLYNWLGDTYSSQLFPTFYKIHGWVDDRIGDWMAANNVTELNWNGTWTGGPWENVAPTLMTKQSMNFRGSAAQNAHNMDHSGKVDVLEQVLDIFLKSGVPESNFAEDVKIDWAPWDKPE